MSKEERFSDTVTRMNELKPLICQCCGGHIDRESLKCPYCETRYNGKLEPLPTAISDKPNGIETLAVAMRIPDETLCGNKEEAMRVVSKMMRDAIAKALEPYVRVQECRSPKTFDRVFTAEIKIVKM